MIPRARHLAAAALSGVLLTLPALTGVAPAAQAASASKVQTVTLARTKADVQKVADYWKPDKLKDADSYSPAAPASEAAPASSSGAVSVSNQAIAALRKAQGTQNVAPVAPKQGAAKTMGKVFFRFGDKEYWCSASSVAARNLSVVATAAHCAYDPRQGKAADYWIFVPNPTNSGEMPDGIYVGSSISIHEDWVGKNDYDYDYAFVTVHRGFTWEKQGAKYVAKDVGRLQENVGGQGLELGKKAPVSRVDAFGYPAGPQPDGTRPFNGTTLQTCVGSTRKAVAPSLELNFGVQLAPCNFSKGASGGPWLVDWQSARKLGNLVGVNSLTWNRDAKGEFDAVSSPYFGAVTGDVYRHAAAQKILSNVM
ncbi:MULTISPECIES: trypsin-like serine protease [Nonomuraea]|uniref:trypsin-like serine peptidase n=1 Tax=Nonomuraea TaxID=83681 RepID=UPI001C5F9DD3|nr:trypsin-like serine protease [Nonomuraea ceibae]